MTFTEHEAMTIIGFSEACADKNKVLRKKLKQINLDINTLVSELNGISKLLEPQRKQGHKSLLNKLLQELVERLTALRYEKASIKSQLKDNSSVVSFVKKAMKMEEQLNT